MTQLIEELKEENAFIQHEIEKVKKNGFQSSESKKILIDAKEAIFRHLDKEEKILFPTLHEAQARHELPEGFLEPFKIDLKDLSTQVIEFFDKYEFDGHDEQFFKDIEKLTNLLEERMKKEEMVLYNKYDKVKGNQELNGF